MVLWKVQQFATNKFIFGNYILLPPNHILGCVKQCVCIYNQPVFELRMMANKWHIFKIPNGKYQVNMLLSNEFRESQRGVWIEYCYCYCTCYVIVIIIVMIIMIITVIIIIIIVIIVARYKRVPVWRHQLCHSWRGLSSRPATFPHTRTSVWGHHKVCQVAVLHTGAATVLIV